MQTKLNPAKLYKEAMRRSKGIPITQEPKTFSKGGALMRPMQEEQDDMLSAMSVEDRVRAIYSAQRQMLKDSM
jgi:hypothetical protein